MNVQLTDKTESIFRNTLLLIKDQGFHGTPMSQIAKASDVAIGTIYHYFPSKDKLIIELHHYCKRIIYHYIFTDLDESLSYKDQFFIVFKRFCLFHLERTDVSKFLEQFYSSPYNEMIRKNDAEFLHEENRLIAFLLKGMELGILKKVEPHILSNAYIGAALSYSKTVIYGKVDFNENQLNDLTNIIWNGVKNNKI